MLHGIRVALVHDWLLGMRGGERCLEEIASLFGEADIYTLFYDASGVSEQLRARPITPSVLNTVPRRRSIYRHLLPVYRLGTADLSRRISRKYYDLVVSISHCAAKNVEVDVPHYCYCLTPPRYLWDQYESYFGGRRFEPLVRAFRPMLQRWDIAGAKGVTRFAAISEFVRARIARLYRREAQVIYPPVRTDWIVQRDSIDEDSADERLGFLSVNALVPYKNTQVIVQAFNDLGLPLTIVGEGPDERRLRSLAAENISFISHVSESELADLYRRSKALIFAAEEDFGMVPVEMLAAGRPVIALGRGGVLETVTPETGILFPELSKEYIVRAVRRFLEEESRFEPEVCRRQAAAFSREKFRERFSAALGEFLAGARQNSMGTPPDRLAGQLARC